jgi:cell wall-associated NlpC family hydrolase
MVTVVVISLVVVLIVVQTIATVLTGGQTSRDAGRSVPPPIGAPVVAMPPPTGEPSLPGDLGSRVIQLAQTWLGVPYLFGGCSRGGVDCSCLVQNVYASVGIRLPHVAVDQFNATVPINDPQPGDVVFFANTYQPGISHVGIYIGNGLQINAPTTGQVVSVAPVFTGYWGAHYAGVHRVRE